MVFSSAVFLFLFLPAVLLVYYNPWVKTRAFRNIFLLLASLGFYAWGEPVFVFLMMISIAVTWLLGLGRMFGFHFSENFNYPYISASVTEFWRRWHISLSTWFRDYVYIPLGGNRVSKGRWIRNLFVVWLLTGLWHGANWTFLCWGLLYFAVLLFEKLAGFPKRRGIFAHVYTMLVVGLAWVIFRGETLPQGLQFVGNMFGAGSSGWADGVFAGLARNSLVVMALAVVLSAPVYGWARERLARWSDTAERVCRSAVCLAVFVLSVLQVVASSYSPFIYFNF